MQDFEHLKKCEPDMEHISSEVPEEERTTWVTVASNGDEVEFKVNFTVGQIAADKTKTSLLSAGRCEALKVF